MADIRHQIFLATKPGQRDRDEAWGQLNSSLERLQTDRLDLLQLHAVGNLAELDRSTRAGGALEAAVRAQERGLAGAVGFTGHNHQARPQLEALLRFPFATVLTPVNPVLWRDEAHRADYKALVDEVQRPHVGLLTIKTVSRRNWPSERDDHPYATWSEPYDDQERISAAVLWVLAHPEVTGLGTAGDVRLLERLLTAERERMSTEDANAGFSVTRSTVTSRGDAFLESGRGRGPPGRPSGRPG